MPTDPHTERAEAEARDLLPCLTIEAQVAGGDCDEWGGDCPNCRARPAVAAKLFVASAKDGTLEEGEALDAADVLRAARGEMKRG